MTVEDTDARSQAVQKPGTERISLDYMKSQIAHTHVFVLGDALQALFDGKNRVPPEARVTREEHPAMFVMTMCVLTMRSGFVVVGKSAPMDPKNFDAEHGAKLAYDQAVQQLWPLFAFGKLQAKHEGWG